MKLFNLILLAAESEEQAASCKDNLPLLIIVGLLFVAVLVLPFFSRKKMNKQVNELRNSIEVGDIVKTIGAIVGKVVAVNQISPVEKEVVIETGIEGKTCTLVLDIQGIYMNLSKSTQPAVQTASKPESKNATEVKNEEATEVVAEENNEAK